VPAVEPSRTRVASLEPVDAATAKNIREEYAHTLGAAALGILDKVKSAILAAQLRSAFRHSDIWPL
jgi:hypothetical protein